MSKSFETMKENINKNYFYKFCIYPLILNILQLLYIYIFKYIVFVNGQHKYQGHQIVDKFQT